MLQIGSVIGVGAISANFATNDPLHSILPIVALTLGIICLASFAVTRLIRLFSLWK